MKKVALILLSTIVILSVTCAYASCANTTVYPYGPAPNSGDGVPDGSGYNRSDWPNEESPAMGPAPNSGDGIPDGSGF